MRTRNSLIGVLAAILLGLLFGCVYSASTFKPVLDAFMLGMTDGAEWGHSTSGNGKRFASPISINGYEDIEGGVLDDAGRKHWYVQVYPDTPFEFGYEAIGPASESIEEVSVQVGAKKSDRQILLAWHQSDDDARISFDYRVIRSGNMIAYYDIDGNRTWDVEEDWKNRDGKWILQSRLILIDDQYHFVSEWKTPYSETCRIVEPDGGTSVAMLIDGGWTRVDAPAGGN